MASVGGQRSYYEAALVALRFAEVRRPTRRRFGPEADATWATFRGDLGTSARIDLLLRDADAEWQGAFGVRVTYALTALASDEAFGATWTPLDNVDAEELWRRIVVSTPPATVAETLAQVARAWKLDLMPVAFGAVSDSEKLVVAGPSAIATTITRFSDNKGLDWGTVSIIASPPAHRQLAMLGAVLLNANKPTHLFDANVAASALPRGVRLVVSADAQSQDRETAERVSGG
jgi:hypothetical protein